VLLFNASIYCEENNIKNWMLVDQSEGVILAVGTHSDLHKVETSWNPDMKIDLEGMFVLPVNPIIKFTMIIIIITIPTTNINNNNNLMFTWSSFIC
jgi:hypothetical protein